MTELSRHAAGAGARPIGAAAACSTAAIRFSVTLPLGRELWGEADAVLAVGTRLFMRFTQWGIDDDLAIIRVDADPEEPARSAQARGRADRRRRADPARA